MEISDVYIDFFSNSTMGPTQACWSHISQTMLRPFSQLMETDLIEITRTLWGRLETKTQ